MVILGKAEISRNQQQSDNLMHAGLSHTLVKYNREKLLKNLGYSGVELVSVEDPTQKTVAIPVR